MTKDEMQQEMRALIEKFRKVDTPIIICSFSDTTTLCNLYGNPDDAIILLTSAIHALSQEYKKSEKEILKDIATLVKKTKLINEVLQKAAVAITIDTK